MYKHINKNYDATVLLQMNSITEFISVVHNHIFFHREKPLLGKLYLLTKLRFMLLQTALAGLMA